MAPGNRSKARRAQPASKAARTVYRNIEIRTLHGKLKYAERCLRDALRLADKYELDGEERVLLLHTLTNSVAPALGQVVYAVTKEQPKPHA